MHLDHPGNTYKHGSASEHCMQCDQQLAERGPSTPQPRDLGCKHPFTKCMTCTLQLPVLGLYSKLAPKRACVSPCGCLMHDSHLPSIRKAFGVGPNAALLHRTPLRMHRSRCQHLSQSGKVEPTGHAAGHGARLAGLGGSVVGVRRPFVTSDRGGG